LLVSILKIVYNGQKETIDVVINTIAKINRIIESVLCTPRIKETTSKINPRVNLTKRSKLPTFLIIKTPAELNC